MHAHLLLFSSLDQPPRYCNQNHHRWWHHTSLRDFQFCTSVYHAQTTASTFQTSISHDHRDRSNPYLSGILNGPPRCATPSSSPRSSSSWPSTSSTSSLQLPVAETHQGEIWVQVPNESDSDTIEQLGSCLSIHQR